MDDTRHYAVVIESDEDGVLIATVPALPKVVERGDTEEEVVARVATALEQRTISDMVESGEEVPPGDAPEPWGRVVLRDVEVHRLGGGGPSFRPAPVLRQRGRSKVSDTEKTRSATSTSERTSSSG